MRKIKQMGKITGTVPRFYSAETVQTMCIFINALADIVNELNIRVEKLMQESCVDCDCVEVVRCKDCRHLDVINRDTIYAYCIKTGRVFEPFGSNSDTREEFCSLGEMKEADK